MTRTRKRFWAWTLTLIAALLAVVWVGSMKVTAWTNVLPWRSIRLGGGRLFISRPSTGIEGARIEADILERWVVRWGFEYVDAPSSTVGPFTIRMIPLWPFVLLTGVPGVWMMVKTRKHTNPNACPACGYDRTGLPQTSTGPAPCPECGKGKCNDAVCGRRDDTVKR